MKNQTCCFTGHRSIPKEEMGTIQRRLETEILNLIRQGVRYFGAGGALSLAAQSEFVVRQYAAIRI